MNDEIAKRERILDEIYYDSSMPPAVVINRPSGSFSIYPDGPYTLSAFSIHEGKEREAFEWCRKHHPEVCRNGKVSIRLARKAYQQHFDLPMEFFNICLIEKI